MSCGLAVHGHHVAGTTFAAAALGGDAQFKLDVIEVHTGRCVAGNVPVADALADANNHVDSPGKTVDMVSINKNYFYLHLTLVRQGKMRE